MKTTKLLAFAALATMLLGSCDKKSDSGYQLDYLAVQMSKGDNWSIIDKDGKEVVKEEYPADARISLIRDGVFWVIQNDKYQLFSVNSPKKPLVDEEFSKVTDFYGGVSAVSVPNQPIRIINTSGKTIATLPKNIKRCYIFSPNGYAVFCDTDNKEGLLDSKGNVVIEQKYSNILFENDGVVLAKKNEDDKSYLILDTKGKKQGEINTDKYKLETYAFYEGKLLVRAADGEDNASLIALDKTGKKLFNIKKSSARYSYGHYIDGYLVFKNAEEQGGVVDDKGEVVIRPKYESMYNLGEGLFIAEKNEKSGIIDANDETIIDFDYKSGGIYRLGHNFLMQDNDEWSLVGKDGKEIVAFSNIGCSRCDIFAEYVDVEGLTARVTKKLIELSEPRTAAQVCSASELNIDDAHYCSNITYNVDFDDKIKLDCTICFNGSIAAEKTHTEKVNDGWFTYTRTVSDGWEWSDAVARSISGTLTLNEVGTSAKDICNAILEKLTQQDTWKKVEDNTYSKNVTLNGSTYECRLTLMPEDDTISVGIYFNE